MLSPIQQAQLEQMWRERLDQLKRIPPEELRFGDVVEMHRVERQWSRRELGRRIGRSVGTISGTETYCTDPNRSKIELYAKAFGYENPDDFFDGRKSICPTCGKPQTAEVPSA